MMWSEKYRPGSVSQMVGNEESRAEAVSWLAKWRPGTKPILLVGPPGTGKTTVASLLAAQFGYDMIGLNASDVRSKSKLTEVLEPVLGNAGVTGRPPLIFIDEVDGIHGRSDYGGTAALADILKRSSVPIILAANDDTADKMKPVKKAAVTIQFRRVPPRLLRAYLERIVNLEASPAGGSGAAVDREGSAAPAKKLSYGLLIKAVSRSRGDMRSLLNMAQSYTTGFNPPADSSIDALAPEDAVPAFFGADSAGEAMLVLRRMQADPRERIHAFYSSVITGAAGARGPQAAAQAARLLSILSEADVLYGRIMRTQNWRILRYLDAILLQMYFAVNGSAASSAQHRDAAFAIKYAQYNVPWPLLSRIRFDGAAIRKLASHMSAMFHASSSSFGSIYMPYMLHCMACGMIDAPDPKDSEKDEHADIISKEMARTAAGRMRK